MTRHNTEDAPSSLAGRNILPLPEDVAAQIKSSTAIVSLTGVVLELLKNSLDAQASQIDATVDFARGACTIEDDGLGISPLEFKEEGGLLGKLHCTSKYHAAEALLGRYGTFLASLAAMSLLTITSHHHKHRSQNSITFHHAKAIERQLPASAHHQVHGKHGTRVTVRNLFGNLPVRVKQRAILSGERAEQERLWEGLKREIAGLLLSWRGIVSLKLRDGDNRTVLSFNTTGLSDKNVAHQRSVQLSSLLSILTQAKYIAFDEWASWIPVSASTPALSITGAISLDPAPSKHVQFISLGNRPLRADAGHNELFDEVNRMFALSGFGTVEDDADIAEHEKDRRQADRRFKNDGYTNRQLRARKGVERHPKFHLRISLEDARRARVCEDEFIDDDTNLENVMEVLVAMITQWLSVHHFRPRKLRQKRDRPNNASEMYSDSTEADSPAVSVPDNTRSRPVPLRPSSTSAASRKRKRLGRTASHEPIERPQPGAFADWSRIKSGKADFFNKLPMSFKSGQADTAQSLNCHDVGTDGARRGDGFASFNVKSLSKGALNDQAAPEESSAPTNTSRIEDKENDDVILWIEPLTKRPYLLDARTGCLVQDSRPRPNTDPAGPSFGSIPNTSNMSMRLPTRPSTATPGKTPWLDDVLQNWDNPIFKSSEKRIQQIGLHEQDFGYGHAHSKNGCSRTDIEKAFDDACASGPSRLSKEGLKNARVISQVDRKFILVKMPKSGSNEEPIAGLLVLIDQHAADERIKVESLLGQLCMPLPENVGYRSRLGHEAKVTSVMLEKPLQFTISAQEHAHLTAHASRFAAWGILYDTLKSATPSDTSSSTNEQHMVSTTHLPPTISERCKSQPRILISLLRSSVWKYTDDARLLSTPLPGSQDCGTDWVRRLASCPPALVELVNSRACRSAVMFNDQVSVEECRDLVRKLSGCVFPFMCAHGRPSMVPLVDLGRGTLEGKEEAKQGEGFVQAWKRWQGRC